MSDKMRCIIQKTGKWTLLAEMPLSTDKKQTIKMSKKVFLLRKSDANWNSEEK